VFTDHTLIKSDTENVPFVFAFAWKAAMKLMPFNYKLNARSWIVVLMQHVSEFWKLLLLKDEKIITI
jgi:hypothetical protein